MTNKELLEYDVDKTSKALKAMSGGGPTGLTPDSVKTSPRIQGRERCLSRCLLATPHIQQSIHQGGLTDASLPLPFPTARLCRVVGCWCDRLRSLR